MGCLTALTVHSSALTLLLNAPRTYIRHQEESREHYIPPNRSQTSRPPIIKVGRYKVVRNLAIRRGIIIAKKTMGKCAKIT